MTNAQTEARAIAQKLQDVVDGTDGWLNVDKAAGIIATALAEKDAELAAVKAYSIEMLHRKDEQFERAERAEAALAEARKAMKLADQMMTKDSLCEAERLEEGLSVVRRALTGGQEDG